MCTKSFQSKRNVWTVFELFPLNHSTIIFMLLLTKCNVYIPLKRKYRLNWELHFNIFFTSIIEKKNKTLITKSKKSKAPFFIIKFFILWKLTVNDLIWHRDSGSHVTSASVYLVRILFNCHPYCLINTFTFSLKQVLETCITKFICRI